MCWSGERFNNVDSFSITISLQILNFRFQWKADVKKSIVVSMLTDFVDINTAIKDVDVSGEVVS